MNTNCSTHQPNQTGSALALTMIMTAVALAILGGALTWSANSTKLTHRSIDYTKAIAAAEAGTEKVVSKITYDYLTGGQVVVQNNLNSYRNLVPNTTETVGWTTNPVATHDSHWRFCRFSIAGMYSIQPLP